VTEVALRSALSVVIPEAASITDSWRERTSYAKPSRGVPAHVTVLFPFVPASDIDDELIDELGTLMERHERFVLAFRECGRFPGVLYLAPDPAAPLVRLTQAVWSTFPRYLPYEAEFDAIVPHLTAAEGDDDVLDQAETEIAPSLPILANVRAVTLLEELEPDSARWRVRAELPLRTG